jgi:hypothetical protein
MIILSFYFFPNIYFSNIPSNFGILFLPFSIIGIACIAEGNVRFGNVAAVTDRNVVGYANSGMGFSRLCPFGNEGNTLGNGIKCSDMASAFGR